LEDLGLGNQIRPKAMPEDYPNLGKIFVYRICDMRLII